GAAAEVNVALGVGHEAEDELVGRVAVALTPQVRAAGAELADECIVSAGGEQGVAAELERGVKRSGEQDVAAGIEGDGVGERAAGRERLAPHVLAISGESDEEEVPFRVRIDERPAAEVERPQETASDRDLAGGIDREGDAVDVLT